MKSDRLQDALGAVRDDYILDAHGQEKSAKRLWLRWGTLAACLCLVAVCAVGVPKLLHKGTQDPAPVKPYAPDISQMTPADPGTDPAPVPGPDAQPIPIPGPGWNQPDPGNPGTTPVEPPSYDWPVLYNEVDTLPDAESHYFSLAGRPLTETEVDAVLPIRGGDWFELESATADFVGFIDENGCINEGAKLDSIELDFVKPNGGRLRIGMWPAEQTSRYSWASQFDPKEYAITNFGSDQERVFVSLFRCDDSVWTYFTCGDVSYCVCADELFRQGAWGDDFCGAVNAILKSDNNSPDLSILVPNP